MLERKITHRPRIGHDLCFIEGFLCVYSVVVKKRKTLPSFREKETVQEYNGQATGFLKIRNY